MAERRTEFAYHNIELYKWESLGSGSYGGVCKAKCDGLLCAAKIMHPTLFDLHDPGAASYLSKFQEECHLLSLARHPNVVQYLGTSCDPDTRLPVLLMELCQESLTAFLERSPGPLPHHIQLDISHDIALALVYLHSNGLIHRDLTGNNVLMAAGPRAKITDFGMSKLTCINHRMTAHTLCPGNLLYMSPEALDEAKSYTAKLDIFSFGVIVIQILTRLFPNPTDRFRTVYVAEYDEMLRRGVPEAQRRIEHLNLIPDNHSLKPLAISCLMKEHQRPSAVELSETLSNLKTSSAYAESITQLPHHSNGVEQLDARLPDRKTLTETRANEEEKCKVKRVAELEKSLSEKDKKIQELQWIIRDKDRMVQGATCAKNSEVAVRKDISTMSWFETGNAPEIMCRGASVVHGDTAYFRPGGSNNVYCYQKILGGGEWSLLAENPNVNFGLAVIDDFLTSVGGQDHDGPVSALLYSTKERWREEVAPGSVSFNAHAALQCSVYH